MSTDDDNPKPPAPPEASLSEPDDEVGYARPPRASRFKPGKSGNPSGRPKGVKNSATILREELGALMSVTVNGRKQRLSTRTVLMKRLVSDAANGDRKALQVVIQMDEGGAPETDQEAVSQAERESALRRLPDLIKLIPTKPKQE